jgi:hypothetical protein
LNLVIEQLYIVERRLYIMDGEVYYGSFLKALSGADPIQARRFAAAKALEIGAVSQKSLP